MRKNDLIKLLNEIEGNPEVVIWNNQVEDWQHIQPPKIFPFHRYKKNFMIESAKLQRKFNSEPELTKDEIENIGPDDWCVGETNDIKSSKDSKFQTCSKIVLQMKSRGIKSFDRLGSINY